MTSLETLFSRFEAAKEKIAIVTTNNETTYGQLLSEVEKADWLLRHNGCARTTVLLVGDYAAPTIAFLLALWRLGNIVALSCATQDALIDERAELAQATRVIKINEDNQVEFFSRDHKISDPILSDLYRRQEAGFVIFSSGSTGKPKASIHSASAMLDKHILPKRCLTSISFLLFDHIGGLNTMFYILFNVGKLVIPTSRSPQRVAQAIEKYRVETITASPTFLNLLVMSDALTLYDFKSLQVINYGTEPMPESLLKTLTQKLPWARFLQAYGLTETGVLPVRSVSSSSTWLTFDKSQCDIRIVDGLLEVKVKTSMLGYINVPSPFTQDGYLKTGDAVLQEGDCYRVLGRHSDLINVGGEKVYPGEIENVLRDMPGVVEVAVTALENPIMGQVVGAAFKLHVDESLTSFRQRLYKFCHQKLQSSHIPRKILITDAMLHTTRAKKIGANTLRSRLIEERRTA
jgi:acyl-coenzyme A synthetase/AMP-(fatty) acid ligase